MKVVIKNVTKTYGSNTAVKDFSADLTDGHLICLLGPSGCGKSTLLNMLSGIVDVTSGQIFFDGNDVTKMPPDKRNIGMVFQNYALYPHLTVLENIAFPLEVLRVPKKERLEKAEKTASLVHVENLLKRFPGQLSGGQQQRVAIARALIKNPSLLLMDEPLSNLDARLRLEMRDEIRRIQQETGVTTIFVTHDQEEAMSISDSILLMKDGELVQSSTCQELYENPNCRFTADFIGNPPTNNLENGELILKDGLPHFITKNGLDFSLPQKFSDPSLSEKCAGKNLTLSIRPESFMLTEKDNAAFEAKVKRTSLLGKEQIVYLDFGGSDGKSVRVILDNEKIFSPGDTVCLRLKTKGVFIFDGESGERLY